MAFELEHHALNVFVVLVRSQELQAFLWIAPFQDLDGFLPCAPGIHFALVRHVKINRIASGKRPAVIFDSVILARGKEPKHRADRPARPVGRSAADLG